MLIFVNGNYYDWTYRMTSQLECHHVEYLCVCLCVVVMPWSVNVHWLDDHVYAIMILWKRTECLKYVIIIMIYCPSWTFPMTSVYWWANDIYVRLFYVQVTNDDSYTLPSFYEPWNVCIVLYVWGHLALDRIGIQIIIIWKLPWFIKIMVKTVHGQSWYTINVHIYHLLITRPSVIGKGPRGTIDHDYNHAFETLDPFNRITMT